MAFNDKDDFFEERTPYPHESYSSAQWKLFDTELHTHYIKDKKLDETKFLIDNKALQPKLHPRDRYHAVKNRKLYEELTHKLSQWGVWAASQQMAERQRLDELQKIADQMQV